MGRSVWWVAVEGKAPGQVLDELGLEAGEVVDDYDSAPLTGIPLPSGWYLVAVNKDAPVWYEYDAVAGLSKGCRAILFQGQETAMYTTLSEYRDGRRIWHLEHDGDPNAPVAADGDPPPEFHAINDEIDRGLEEDEDASSRYEVTVRLGKALVGFEYYEWAPEDPQELHARVAGLIHEVPVGRGPSRGARGPGGDASPPAPPSAPRPWWKFW